MPDLGLFMMPLHPPSRDFATVLEEDRDLVKLADKLGFAEAWMGEHYTSTAEPVTSPLLFNASLAAETSRIKLGTGVISLPQQHPVVVAGHVALFDHLSKGRCLFGIGAGGLSSDWEIFDNLDGRDRALKMIESIEIIQKVWRDEPPWTHEGSYYSVSMTDRVFPEIGIGRFIKPYQDPHPPIAVSLRSANSMTAKFAGERGWIPISGNFVPAADIASHWPTYAEGAEKAGIRPDPSIWRVGRSVLITETDEEAEALLSDPDGGFAFYYSYLTLQGKLAGGDFSTDVDWDAVKAAAVAKSKDLIIAGTKKTVLDKLVAFRDEVGDFGVLMLTGHDMADDKARWVKSFTIMAEEVGPALTRYMNDRRHASAAE